MQTVFITVSRGIIARNLLQNEFYRRVRERYRVVILTPAAHDRRFLETFSHPNVTFEHLEEFPQSPWELVLGKFHKMLIFNKSTELKSRFGVIGLTRQDELSDLRFFLMKALFLPLSKITALRDVVRWIDLKTTQKKLRADMAQLLERYHPKLVFVTNITSDTEVALIKESRARGLRTIAMPKSWDNLSWIGFRVKADRLVVWNEFMFEQAQTFQNYRPHQIQVVGVPQNDCYADTSRLWTRKHFCKVYGLDPEKKIIFFGSEGKLFDNMDRENSEILHSIIQNNQLPFPAQLLIRPHYGYRNDEQKFNHLLGKPDVSVDLFNTPSSCFRDAWDYSQEFTDRFLNSLHHSDVIVNTCSTLSLDGVAFNKPLVGLGFDGYTKLPYRLSIIRWYDNDYYIDVLKTGAVEVVKSKEELALTLSRALTAPDALREARLRLQRRFCHALDGKAGERLFEVVRSYTEGS